MTRRYTPQEKKRMSYKRDRISGRNSARARRNNRVNKRHALRIMRRRTRVTLRRMLNHFPIRDDLPLLLRPNGLWYSYTDGTPLGEHIEQRRALRERRAVQSVLNGYFSDDPDAIEERCDVLSARLAHWRTGQTDLAPDAAAHLARVWFMPTWHRRGLLGARDRRMMRYPAGRDDLVKLFELRPHERARFEAWLACEGFTADAPPPR